MSNSYLRKQKISCSTSTCTNTVSKELSKIHHKSLPEGELYCSECVAAISGHFCAYEKCPKARRAVWNHKTGSYCPGHSAQLSRYGEGNLKPLGASYERKTGKIVHGKASTYNNKKCRCDLCTTAWNAYCADRKAANVGIKDVGDRQHGKDSTYHYGCRCEDCRLGHAGYVWEQRQIRELRKAMPHQEHCDCCGKEYPKLVTDHVHGTLTIRGLICHACNTGIGKLGDDLEGLLRAVAYLERTK